MSPFCCYPLSLSNNPVQLAVGPDPQRHTAHRNSPWPKHYTGIHYSLFTGRIIRARTQTKMLRVDDGMADWTVSVHTGLKARRTADWLSTEVWKQIPMPQWRPPLTRRIRFVTARWPIVNAISPNFVSDCALLLLLSMLYWRTLSGWQSSRQPTDIGPSFFSPTFYRPTHLRRPLQCVPGVKNR